MEDYITTYTDIQFNPFNPRKEDIVTEDIAHALSLLCRANGHFRNFYSVGQHSINCAKEAKLRGYTNRIQLACLLHDASEAYISDVTRPVKKELPDYLEIEDKLQGLIFGVYGLPNLTTFELTKVKEIDDQVLAYELQELLDVKITEKDELIGEYNLEFRMMDEVKKEFIKLVEELQNKLYLDI